MATKFTQRELTELRTFLRESEAELERKRDPLFNKELVSGLAKLRQLLPRNRKGFKALLIEVEAPPK